MTSIELKNALKAEPFRPFVVHLGSGRSLPVKHPEFVAVHPNNRTAILFVADGGFEIVDILMIQSIEFPSQNGHGRRRKAG